MKFFWPALEAGPGTPARALRPTRPVGVGSSGGGEHGPATSVHEAARSLEGLRGLWLDGSSIFRVPGVSAVCGPHVNPACPGLVVMSGNQE